MKLVVIESPYAGDVERNMAYLKRAMLDSLARGEAPYASHALYTQFLDDTVPEERELGMKAGFAWGELASKVVVYGDYGVSRGMQAGIDRAIKRNIPLEFREIGPNPGEGPFTESRVAC